MAPHGEIKSAMGKLRDAPREFAETTRSHPYDPSRARYRKQAKELGMLIGGPNEKIDSLYLISPCFVLLPVRGKGLVFLVGERQESPQCNNIIAWFPRG